MKEITTVTGPVAQVSDEDFEYLSQFRWYAHKRKKYVFRGISLGQSPDRY